MKSYSLLGLLMAGTLALAGCEDGAKPQDQAGKDKTAAAAKTGQDKVAKTDEGKAAPKGDTKPASDPPAGDIKLDEAKKFLGQFLKEGADHAALSKDLVPKDEDYAAVFVDDVVAKAKETYGPMWKDGAMKLAPKEGQTELLLWAATGAQLQKGEGDAEQFPGGYKKIADKLKPDVVFYRFKFTKPGETIGMAFDGLVYVNGHWTIFPKPWRALK